MRLMCLDDDPRIQLVLGRFLKRLGHVGEFHTATSSFKLAITADPPDLVLLDLGLGHENGIDIIDWLAQDHADIPIVLLSGQAEELLDTARRVASGHGIRVLGVVSKHRMANELPAILQHDIERPRPETAASRAHQPVCRLDDLIQAIATGDILPYYQPIVVPTDGRLVGVEVLARLRLPDGRVLGAGEFIALAETSGLLRDMTESLFVSLMAQAPRLAPLKLGFIAVNLSPLILEDIASLDLVRRLVDAFAGHCTLKVEITETAASAYPQAVMRVAAQIHLLGCSLAIDDFGTGYSSMRALAELPFDSLKIDLSFVTEMFDSPKALRLLRAMIGFAQSLDLQVVAEGVETAAQREVLIAEGVDLAQGYLFGAPMGLDELLSAHAVDAVAREGRTQDLLPRYRREARPKRLIVVDDDQRMLHAIARLASLWGYACQTFQDARLALTAIEIAPPDLLIVDVYMPRIDGFQVIEMVKRIAPQTRILAVSGEMIQGEHTDVLEMCRRQGADAALRKPIGPERLRGTIRNLIGPPVEVEP